MDNPLIFNFKTALVGIDIPVQLNNPFSKNTPEIACIAAKEFQEFIAFESRTWNYDFSKQKGKMFGILVVQKKDQSYGYLGTVSGKLPGNASCKKMVPSIFDDSTDDYFINKGMSQLTEMSREIKKEKREYEIKLLMAKRKEKSFDIQQQLFESYSFLNCLGDEKNILQIFEDSSHGNPPSAAGECTAPKLLQHAFQQQLKPIALAEFWWGTRHEKIEREHQVFYPACKNRCRPILEFMLNDSNLFEQANRNEN